MQTKLKNELSEFCLAMRADIPERSQKVKSALNYCVEILEEACRVLELIEEDDSEIFLENFTEYWESYMRKLMEA